MTTPYTFFADLAAEAPEAACVGLRLFKSILDLPEPKRAGWTT
jgi:hypothetical protein